MIFLILALTACMLVTVGAKPLEKNEKNDGAEIVMKIEKINEQLPGNDEEDDDENFYINYGFYRFMHLRQGAPAKLKNKSNDDAKQKKSYPVYYVNTKVNGRFGKSMRAFTSEEFVNRYPVKY